MEQRVFSFFDSVRKELQDWRQNMPDNYYTCDDNLRESLHYWIGKNRLAGTEKVLCRTGKEAAGCLNQWAIENNRDENLPKLRRFDGNGARIEGLDFHPSYHEMGRKIYGSKIMAMYAQPGNDIVQMTLFYLFAQNGEAGHCCPLACTAGAIKLLEQCASKSLKKLYLPKLFDPNYDTHMHAAQYLTELQGGSDVGANATTALEENGQWRLYGEKWFCSVIDAQLMVFTARPEGAPQGTKGLAAFIAPRYLPDGTPNHFEIRRLKYKIGTRSMASAEMNLKGMIAYPVANAGEGFKYVVDIVLNTSRLYNSFAAAGMTRRAYVEALHFARRRRAFGTTIDQYSLVKRSLALLRTESALQLASSMHIASLAEKLACRTADKEEKALFRFLVNANKYWSSLRCTIAIRESIEIFGGNGTIEEFSVLPRLYRDAIVLESWEGTHNVLCLQLLRDMVRYRIHEAVFADGQKRLEQLDGIVSENCIKILHQNLKTASVHARQLLEMEDGKSQLHIRPWVDHLMMTIQAINLLCEAQITKTISKAKCWMAEYHILRNLQKEELFANEKLSFLEENLAKYTNGEK